MTESERAGGAPDEVRGPIAAFACTALAATFAGYGAGLIVGGIGSRIAMRISAIAADDRFEGTRTEFGARVGEITSDTIFLVLIGGSTGVAGAFIYAAMRRWVTDAGRWRGLAFGTLLLVVLGSAIIEGDNRDFHLFGPPALNIAMFAAIFVLYGVLVVPLFEWLHRILPPLSFGRSGLGWLAAYLVGLILFVISVPGAVLVAVQGVVIAAILAYVLIAMPIASVPIARGAGQFDRLSDLRGHRWAMAAALAVVAAPIVAGLAFNVNAIREIYEANF